MNKEQVEELMKPRIMIHADYLGNTSPVGYIFKTTMPDYYLKFPANFRRVEWWEDRKPEEMPEFLKCNSGIILKVKEWKFFSKVKQMFFYINGDNDVYSPMNKLPCTTQEYTDYINQINK